MAVRNDRDELMDAWRALAGQVGPGWRTIDVCVGAATRFLAGRSPRDTEALVVEVGSYPSRAQLPNGKGFQVEAVDVPSAPNRWLALSRRPNGSAELFTAMAEDVVSTIDRRATGGASALHTFLDRVRAWQAFMDRPGDGRLTLEQELGLYGELQVLADIIHAGVPEILACEGWTGPSGNVHDFRWGAGGIEVKSTLAVGSFPAHVLSLDQLDHTAVHPLFVVGVRLADGPTGTGLAGLVAALRLDLAIQPAAASIFEDRLLEAGFLDVHAPQYARRFIVLERRCFAVDDRFPRLVRGNVPAAISDAQYVLDLDATGAPPVTFRDALTSLGVV